MELRKVAETAATITLGWDAVEGADGYLFYADGKRVSRTFDPKRRTVKFSKGPSSFVVEAVRFAKVDAGAYPSAPPVSYVKVAPRVAYKQDGVDARFCLVDNGNLRPGVSQITSGPNAGKFTDQSGAIYTDLDGLDESGVRSGEPAVTGAREIDGRPICSLPTTGNPETNTGSWAI
jgi:hypothetical protein